MSERKFQCPLCAQKISGDETLAGSQIQCPACQKEITVPRSVMAVQVPSRVTTERSAAAVQTTPISSEGSLVPQPPSRTSLSVAKHAAPEPAAANPEPVAAPIPHRPPTPVTMSPRPSALDAMALATTARKRKRMLTLAVVVAVLGLGAYFGLPALMSTPEETSAGRDGSSKARGAGKNGASGEQADGLRTSAAADLSTAGSEAGSEGAEHSSMGKAANAPIWTMDLKKAVIPKERAHGTIAGKAFALDSARLDPVGPMQLLTLRQGGQTYADRELLVYIRLKPGETLEGKTWSVDPATRTGIPQLLKRWVADPKLPPQSKPFASGYAMKLEFGRAQAGNLPGRIFVSLPDAEKTVVGGTFTARLAGATSPILPVANRK